MPRAILKNGVICPVEALPPNWREGQELQIDAIADEDDSSDLDSWYQDFENLVGGNDPSEIADIERALKIADQQAKSEVRKQMGLP